jgi:hypothetical protein
MANSTAPFELPFSRLFSQFLRTWNYRPTTTWDHVFNPQFFINSNPGDAAVENDVLAEVGSYGKQLGTIIDALGVVLSKLADTDLLPADREALARFQDLAAGVDAAVAKHRPGHQGALTTADTEVFVERLNRLRRQDPTSAAVIIERLRALLPVAGTVGAAG